jgi:hypothetical protein
MSFLVLQIVREPNSYDMRPRVSFMPVPVVENSANPKITNLCTTIPTAQHDLPYGCLRSDTCQYVVQTIKPSTQSQDYITLEVLLSKISPVNLTRRQRLEIALILASSHIQLHPTPWLSSRWSKRDILFPKNKQNPVKVCTGQVSIKVS